MTEENAEAGALLGAVAAGAGGVVGAAVGALMAAENSFGKLLEGAVASSHKFDVNHDNILQSGKIIGDQVRVLRRAYAQAIKDLRIPDQEDDVNQAIAKAWNSRLVGGDESYSKRIEQYIESLDNLVTQLRSTAKQYGFTEDEVKTAMGAVSASS